MTQRNRSLWPGKTPQPWLRLVAAVVAAPVLLAALLTGLAFAVARSTMPSGAEALAVASDAGEKFFILLPTFTLTVGLVGVVFLAAFGLRGVLTWIAVGFVVGAMAPVSRALASGEALLPMQAVIAAGLSVTLFLLIRWLAGVRIS